MGVCQPEARPRVEFSASFSVNLRQLYDYYHKLLMFLKPSQLFKQSSEELTLLVETYLANPKIIDKENLGLCSIDMVHKLHPVDFGSEKVTKQWLIEACLRQNKFVQEFPYQILKFEQSYMHYVQFLYMCFKSPNQIIVPNKLADFMWHSHMQDNVKYKEDSIKMLGKVLNHTDDYSEEQMSSYAVETENVRKRYLRVPERSGMMGASNNVSYHNYAYINYGHSACGGGSDNAPLPGPVPHPHPDHHHHHHKDHHDHHHPHHGGNSHHPNDSGSNSHHHKEHNHHNDHNNNHHNEPISTHHNDHSSNHNTHSNDYGGHVDTHNTHSNCGGGTSNCGGAASNCGGGGSSCGGGGGD